MHHLYPLAKGDPLCPLGFHPQVRWPTRCKRCFRDYKEHGGKRREEPTTTLKKSDTTSSTPSLSTWSSGNENTRSWYSSSNLALENDSKLNSINSKEFSNPSSWESTPDLSSLNDDTHANIPTISLKLPKRKAKPLEAIRTVSDSFSIKQDKPAINKDLFNKNDSLATRAKKLQAIKDSSFDKSKRIHIKDIKTITEDQTNTSDNDVKKAPVKHNSKESLEDDDAVSLAGTETTDTTLVGDSSEYKDEIESLRKELETTKIKCERLEKEKSNILLRRLISMDSSSSKSTSAELLKLQQKCNELQNHLDDYKDEKKILGLKVKELEDELESRPTAQQAQKIADELRSKLLAAETLCEELMDENEDMKKEMRDLEEEMEEMQDNFREDQADEYTSLKKELEQTTKNCRILSFKLRKTERKVEQLETEKAEAEKKFNTSGGQNTANYIEKIKNLEKELSSANEKTEALQKEIQEFKIKSTTKKKAPMLGTIGRLSSDGKVSRESLTRGGSQEDPVQLLRDLQDSMEREADLREQLKFAEEETMVTNRRHVYPVELPTYRKPIPLVLFHTINVGVQTDEVSSKNVQVSRISFVDNFCQISVDVVDSSVQTSEWSPDVVIVPTLKPLQRYQLTTSMFVQPKGFSPMATLLTPMGRKLSPTNNRLSVNSSTEKDEGISDDEDLSEIKLQLELSEQEASVLRKKVEELEAENERVKRKSKDLQDKLASAKPRKGLFSTDKETEKVKTLEDELKTIKKNLSEKEKECERLQSEINVNRKRSVELQKIKSVDLDQHTLDLKRQLEVIEQEASVLRTRVQNYENENEKLLQENKKLQLTRASKNVKADKSVDKYIDQIATLEVELSEANMKIKELEAKSASSDNVENLKLKLIENERDNLSNTLTKLKQDSLKAFGDRTVKKPNELTSKSQLKTMVNDLENEISEMLVVLNNSETAKSRLAKELSNLKMGENPNESTSKNNLDELKRKLSSLEKEVKNEKASLFKEKQKSEDLNKKLQKTKDTLTSVTEENERNKSNYEKMLSEKNTLSAELSKVKTELSSASSINENYKKIKADLDSKIKELSNMKNELNNKTKELENLEKEHKNMQEKQASLEKSKKSEIKQLESKIEEERKKNKLKENEMLELSEKLKMDKNKLSTQIEDLSNNVLCLESTIKSKNMLIEKLEESLQKEKTEHSTKNKTEAKQIQELRDEIEKHKTNIGEAEKKLQSATSSKKNLEEKLKKSETEWRADKTNMEKTISDLELSIQNEKKKTDLLKANYEKETKNKELELGILRNKIKSLEANSGMGTKKMTEIKREYQDQIEKLESQLSKEKKQYSELTSKYEVLEEEHVVTKAKLVAEIEAVNNQLSSVKKEMDVLEGELQTVRETYNSKQDAWLKEKLQLQEKSKNSSNDLEKARTKSLLEEAQSELDQVKKEIDVANDQMDYMRRENDELRKKLDDFDKVSKIQRTISADSSAMGREIKELKIKLENADKSKKSEMAEFKLRYENQIHVINDELRSLQTQVSRFKRERDTYKHMLEGAQKTISDLKANPSKISKEHPNAATTLDDLDEFRNKVATLEQQISCMEDELSEARLEGSKLKTELISERSTYEVKLSELHSRVNELEEEKILSSGRTKIAGLRTRMELAWQKEREEQQRLLQETATLARDLRQTLYEVERERDKEKLEGKRKVDQLKKITEEEQEETKRKLTELQCDLLELRDAHAKLRTTNEKLRREKERHEREREEMKTIIQGRRKVDQEDDRKLNAVMEQIDNLMQMMPDLIGNGGEVASPYTPTPPRRVKGPKSRESSPGFEGRNSKESSVVRDDKQQQFKSTLHRLVEAADELKRFQKLGEEDRERERIKRVMGMRRATSTEHDNTDINARKRNYSKNGSSSSTTSLHRRSLSLEQTSVIQEQNIWKDAEGRYNKRDVSLDSRLSGGSTQSDATAQEKKKKKGLMGKLKKLTKSRSIDDQDPGTFSSTEGLSSKPSSNTDLHEDPRGSKRDLKDRLTGIFKKSGSSSRSNSLERQAKQKDNTSSTQRPLMRAGSNTNISPANSKTETKRTK
ncbi:Protein SOGA [Popillia japonica]|uniref:Protein SOGA n=1 Tax=Popillia japonica TaxID=7064 RepID=A0AAW1JX28_POPJA